MPLNDPVDPVTVVVTFLRMDQPPKQTAPPLPLEYSVRQVSDCSIALYRQLYQDVGGAYLWWLRRILADRQLQMLLDDPRVSIHVLYDVDGNAAGFYELDRSPWPSVNLAYFGLLPHSVGRGLGLAFLRDAVDRAWREGARAMTVNTCTADHPRARPTYLRAGFHPVREIREEWNIPRRLGMIIPEALRHR